MANDSYIADRIEQHLEGPGYHAPLALKFGEWQEIVKALRGSNGPSSEQWWRDASRERPQRDRLVIAWSEPYGAVLADRMTNNPDFGWSCSGHVTHWMPLPDTPDATKSGADNE